MEVILQPNATSGLFCNPRATWPSQSSGSLIAERLLTAPEPQFTFSAHQCTGSPSVESPSVERSSVGSILKEYSQKLVAAGAALPILEPWRYVYVISPAPELISIVNSGAMSASEVLAEIHDLSGLSKAEVAESLLGVSRMALNNWERDQVLSTANEAKIRRILDVLRRAAKRHHNPIQMRGWLVTPMGSNADCPIELLKLGKIDEARILAITTPSPGLAEVPSWVRTSPARSWVRGAERGQEAYPENDELLIPLGSPTVR